MLHSCGSMIAKKVTYDLAKQVRHTLSRSAVLQKGLKETDLFPEKLPQHHSLLPGVTQRLGTRGSLQGTSAPRLGVQDSAVIACY